MVNIGKLMFYKLKYHTPITNYFQSNITLETSLKVFNQILFKVHYNSNIFRSVFIRIELSDKLFFEVH